MPDPHKNLLVVAKLIPARQTPIIGDLVGMATVLADGKVRLELQINGDLADRLRRATWAENRAKLRDRQKPRPG